MIHSYTTKSKGDQYFWLASRGNKFAGWHGVLRNGRLHVRRLADGAEFKAENNLPAQLAALGYRAPPEIKTESPTNRFVNERAHWWALHEIEELRAGGMSLPAILIDVASRLR